MDFPDNVHIMPFGFEQDRIVETARQSNADKVILLDWLDGIERPPFHNDVREALAKSPIESAEIECDIFDLYETIATISELIIAEHDAGNTVYVNLATGSKITAIGGMIACMVTGVAEPYYVRAETYSTGDEPIGHGIEKKIDLPKYPIAKPDPQRIEILGYLVDEAEATREGISYSVRKKDLIEFGLEQELPFAAHYDGDSYNGYYRRLENHVLEPLQEKGYIEIGKRGRQKIVKPTELGKQSYVAFQYVHAERT
ncbi:DUF6293 family protein [Haloarcula nitratireducens]|uniref:Uncharacterized protein n=1 Tax=Haloarcula nitratireducens TaxID=2487749 RepID=A0AAW4PHG4_9EURY|nr:DUF6293 family protein [Halomicroarcula nitratireducens]MBX0297073.1 hypothetical protein [Halomicroarcula nitratireducens]